MHSDALDPLKTKKKILKKLGSFFITLEVGIKSNYILKIVIPWRQFGDKKYFSQKKA